jgi:hypothetical protein
VALLVLAKLYSFNTSPYGVNAYIFPDIVMFEENVDVVPIYVLLD